MLQREQQRSGAQENQQAQQAAQNAERSEQRQDMRERAPATDRLLKRVQAREEEIATLHAEHRASAVERNQNLKEEFAQHAANREEQGVGMRTDDRQEAEQAIEAFAKTQLRALAMLGEVAYDVAEGQKWDVRDLRERQNRRQELTDQQAVAKPDKQISVLWQGRMSQECDKLDAHFQEQIHVLDIINAALDAQLSRHRNEFQEVLYARLSGAAYQLGLQEVLRRQEADRQALKKDLRLQLLELDQEHEREIAFGALLPYKQQLKAERDENNVRLSENEHIRARINLVLQTLDERIEESAYEKAAYRDSVTLRIPRDMAVLKTRMDLELRDRLRESIEEDGVSETLLREIEIEADIQRTIRARELSIQARRAENRDVEDLLAITEQRIRETAVLQSGELHSRRLPQELVEASEAEWQKLIEQIDALLDEARNR